jgi:hypothetical protein
MIDDGSPIFLSLAVLSRCLTASAARLFDLPESFLLWDERCLPPFIGPFSALFFTSKFDVSVLEGGDFCCGGSAPDAISGQAISAARKATPAVFAVPRNLILKSHLLRPTIQPSLTCTKKELRNRLNAACLYRRQDAKRQNLEQARAWGKM